MVEQIWLDFHEQLLGFIRAKTQNSANAEDILQEVFTKVIKHIDSLQEQDKLNAWLYQICRNTIIDHYRKTRLDNKASSDSELLDALPDHEIPDLETTENNEDQLKAIGQCVKTLSQKLPDRYRQLFIESDLDGRSQTQLAKEHGLALATTKSRTQRARKLLKGQLKACCEWEFSEHGPQAQCKTACGCQSNTPTGAINSRKNTSKRQHTSRC